MAYRIRYDITSNKEKINEYAEMKNHINLRMWIIVAVIIAILGISSRAGWLDFLIPGDKTVTKAAFHSMINDVRNGTELDAAITAFCVEIFDGAKPIS